MTSPTTGGMDERIPFQIKKSSIRKLHAIFTDSQLTTNQDWNRSSIDQWCRAGTIGSVNKSSSDTGPWPVATDAEYNPSITWFAVELGGKRFPTSFGTGSERHPTNVHENVHEMFRAYQRFKGRNDVSGAIFPASLTPMNEGSHGSLSDAWDDLNVPFGGSYTQIWSCHKGVNYKVERGDLESDLTVFNPNEVIHSNVAHPAWWGMTSSLYGGPAFRASWDYSPAVAWDPATPANNAGMGNTWSTHYTNALTGGKFIMAVTLGAMDKASTLIQGVDTERYDFNILFSRKMAISPGAIVTRSWTTEDASADHKYPCADVKEYPVELTVFFDYDVKLTIQNGVIIIDD